MNKKHPLIGQGFTYQNGNDSLEAVCVAVKAGPMVADANSPVGNVKVKSTIQLQLKPANGSPKFWTAPMIYSAA
ncbi:MAG: hypothetical protein RBU21_02940 [FCB group bacterium]|nr:hypothetical protein [FCB group bacterium]